MNHNDGPWVQPGRLSQGQWRPALQPRRQSQRVLADRHGLLGRLGLDRPGPGARDRRADSIPRFGLVDAELTAARRTARASPPSISARTAPHRCARPAFVLHNRLNLFSNFTYFLDDPENGDQFEQAERRVAAGGRVTYRRLGHFFERHTESAIGVQLRRDWLDPVGLYRTAARAAALDDARGRSRSDDGGVYAQTEIEWTRALRTTFGLRADRYQFSVDLGQSAELGRWLGRPGESEGRRHLRPVERHRALRERRHGLPQQRRARRGDHRRSGRPASLSIA